MKPPATKLGVKRCALYTRKSSEEGLEQDFNSLHAQREACASYVSSQKAEGWKALPAVYDDGGFSGGTIERPGATPVCSMTFKAAKSTLSSSTRSIGSPDRSRISHAWWSCSNAIK